MSDQQQNRADGDAAMPGGTTEVEPEVRQPEPIGDDQQPETSRWNEALREILSGNALMTFLAIVLAMLASSVLIVLVDEKVHEAAGYFFARPMDTFAAIWDSVSGAFVSLFQGSVYNFRRPSFADGIRPLTETLTFATPLILAGLGVALSFRAGLFNIGAKGQMLMAAGAAGYVAFAWPMPYGIHLIVAVVAGFVAAAIWGGLVGLLKATTGAHEVIVTIMLNYVAFYFIAWLLRTPGALQAPGSNNPKSPAMLPTAVFPEIFGPRYNLHLGFILAIAATVFVYYLINRSQRGFQFRAVGINPHAAKVAGMNVGANYVWVMVLAGGLAGLAGVAQVLGTVTTGFTEGIDAGIGFDAITVALLGRSRPVGVFFAGVLFGALKAGGYSMQAAEGIPIDIVLVVQSAIVLFIAAPPLVRAIFRLPAPRAGGMRRNASLNGKKAVVTK